MLWASYYGGSGSDAGKDIALDDVGHALVTGDTSSTDFVGANNTYHGGRRDAIVAKLSVSGSVLFASYLGGSHDESGAAIVWDKAGYALVAGWISSTDLSGTNNTHHGRFGDAFVAKVRDAAAPPLPGDTDGDGDVDNTDLGKAFGNFTGPQTNPLTFEKTTAEGDTDGDGDVDNTDLGTAFGHFTGPLASPTNATPLDDQMPATGDIRIIFQDHFAAAGFNSAMAELGISTAGISLDATAHTGIFYELSQGKLEDIDFFIESTPDLVRKRLRRFIDDKHVDANTEDFMLIDIEAFVDLKKLGTYETDPDLQQQIIEAYRLRVEITKELLPNVKVGIWNTVSPPPGKFPNIPSIDKKQRGYHRASELGLFDDVDYLVPTLYNIFGPDDFNSEDAWLDWYYHYNERAINLTKEITDSQGTSIPIAPLLSLLTFNCAIDECSGGTHHKGLPIRPQDSAFLINQLQQYPEVETIIFWSGRDENHFRAQDEYEFDLTEHFQKIMFELNDITATAVSTVSNISTRVRSFAATSQSLPAQRKKGGKIVRDVNLVGLQAEMLSRQIGLRTDILGDTKRSNRPLRRVIQSILAGTAGDSQRREYEQDRDDDQYNHD